MMGDVRPMRLLGACAAHERDAGYVFHARLPGAWAALCGTHPGRRSAGWADHPTQIGRTVTCPRCLARLKRQEGEGGGMG